MYKKQHNGKATASLKKIGWRHPCIYRLFDDFKQNLPVPVALGISFNAADSTYEINVASKDTDGNPYKPWAVADSSGSYYIRRLKNKYLQLLKDSATFYFSVPVTLPDMYQILSTENVSPLNSYNRFIGAYATRVFDPVFVLDITADLIINLVKLINKEVRIEKLAAKAYSRTFSNYFIYMDTGDIIY